MMGSGRAGIAWQAVGEGEARSKLRDGGRGRGNGRKWTGWDSTAGGVAGEGGKRQGARCGRGAGEAPRVQWGKGECSSPRARACTGIQ